MDKKETMLRDINGKVSELIRLTEKNESRKPEDRADHTVTAVAEDGKAVIVSGSAHELEGLLVRLIEKRPEFRQVMENAIHRYGQKTTWKLS